MKWVLKSVCFDALGTLIDISAMATQTSDLWRSEQLDYSRSRAMGDQYVPFSQIRRDALEATLAHSTPGNF